MAEGPAKGMVAHLHLPRPTLFEARAHLDRAEVSVPVHHSRHQESLRHVTQQGGAVAGGGEGAAVLRRHLQCSALLVGTRYTGAER